MKFLNLTTRKLVMILAFLSPIIAHAQATDLFISEYVEGSSYNKSIEIYNGTGNPVDLSSYSLEKDVNGDNSFGSTLSLSGTLNTGETFVIAHSSASSSILAVANLTDYSSMNFNGNDQIRLVKNGLEIDRIGVLGSTFAQDVTYRRNPEVISPASGPQDPQSNGEWTAYTTDDISDLGSHTMNGSDTAKATELFISEYVEGSSYNKAIEIFNGTGAPVDLTAYSLQKDTNGDAIFSSEFSLSGTLADGDVLVIMNSNTAKKNQKYGNILTSSNALNFNGNDQVRLVKNGTEIDRIGTSGGTNFGQDVTFVRDETVGSPATGEQDPRNNGEWLAYGVDEFNYLGTHTMNATSTGGGSSSTNTTEILISEYVEGSSYNKAIELYNGTGATVDLSAYSLEKDTNGDNIFGSTFTLSGTLNNSETYIITHSSADATLLGLANITDSGSMNFNGNDQVRLLKDGVEIDRIGISGGADFAIDITYVRDKNITSPIAGEQDPATNGEWIALNTDDFSNLGIHPSDVTGSTGGGGTVGGSTGGSGTGGSDPGTYYDGTSGLSGAALKQKLHEIIRGHVRFPYTSSSTDVWDILKVTDEDPANSNNLILLYTGRSQDKSTQDTGSGDGDAWNREHVWSKSHGFPNSSDTAYTDVHHLRPADRTVNTARSNKDFDNGGTPHSEATLCYTDTDSWEPRDAVKGDVARMMFYMVVRYEYGAYDLELVDYTGTDNLPIFGKLSTLLQWHQQDPVDDWERNRNEIIFSQFQGNRNPFIDHPEFVNAIWGTSAARIMSNEEKLENSTLKVYPNPSNGQFKVELPANTEMGSYIRIIDLNGRVVNKLKATQQSINIDISTAPAGIYFLQIATDNGFLFERISKQ